MAPRTAPAAPAARAPSNGNITSGNKKVTPVDPIDRAAYPFADRWIDLPAGRMHYVDEGAGAVGAPGSQAPGVAGQGGGTPGAERAGTLLFVHGTPTWSFEWRHLIRDLSQSHRCVAPDHLGFGLSERPEGFAYTPEAHAENLAAFVRALDLRDITLIVHDFGGPIGLPLALAGDGRVKRLVVINSWMWSFRGDKAMERPARLAGTGFWKFLYRRANFSLKMLMPYAYGDKRKLTPGIRAQYLDRFPDADSRGMVLWALAKSLLGSDAHYASLWDRRAELSRLPALIIWGLKDKAFPPPFLAKWKTALPGASVAEIAGAGHWPHEEEPGEVAEALRKFLAL
jgi:haloalkane dehalogenase